MKIYCKYLPIVNCKHKKEFFLRRNYLTKLCFKGNVGVVAQPAFVDGRRTGPMNTSSLLTLS